MTIELIATIRSPSFNLKRTARIPTDTYVCGLGSISASAEGWILANALQAASQAQRLALRLRFGPGITGSRANRRSEPRSLPLS
ncbi:hypothetical protein F2Q65_18270 [Thiohalocapsa marina]|uniref:Uncharacterized protein n=1 Tax=Thiohalocapsa marina TaxID=424902 RepID=A0A5M8FEU2_9GAMM|nr:hypothetical protein [Thiohalocapsa marina]KAA6182226.1 hypothetical protein F2Q65_18270 [Thiohalocapsa marina]